MHSLLAVCSLYMCTYVVAFVGYAVVEEQHLDPLLESKISGHLGLLVGINWLLMHLSMVHEVSSTRVLMKKFCGCPPAIKVMKEQGLNMDIQD